MQLLQHRKNVLISYLRPFVFDPLIQNFNPCDNEPINASSLVAINNIKRKLNGIPRKYQTFMDIPLSPEGHIKFIIDEAKNPANLSRMYFYWSPYV
jgi:phosphatidylinositol kinase/protein kinase (PI-3  family)